MKTQRIEYEFLSSDLMADIRKACPDASLRDLEAKSGVSISVFSRWDHGGVPDMNTFMQVCASFGLTPGNYFRQVVWTREDQS